ncbi:DNA polymerase III subunit alpha [Deferribacterales bacterium Es71-Z0220]|uniref:DNA polymerase III subunit alpha n=1 Tax=Deferrivibrio essentukiensis TaxID=2880922 RepID=UPI001F60696B|nr:DNA polymerase III subunit alpha [Deferrivibrio essentukiensis]MCB4203940.1 DNA polymerase III subunit alpha [Deferrivibrio essentukiensis]
MKEFVHLHLHSQYSLLDGAILIPDLIDKLKEQKVKSCAITDHGTMHGIVDFYKQCHKNEIKPIIGCEVYVAPDDRRNREYGAGEDKNYHLILLAKNNKGLENLQYLVSMAQLEGFYYKPRIDKQLLSEYSEGLIGLSACLAGEPPRHIMRGDYQKAVAAAKEYEAILGKGNYYLELQDNGIDEQKIVNNQLINISKNENIPLIATNDCHYLNEGDHTSHQVLMCIQMQATINSKNKLEFHSDKLYVKSPEEMWKSFDNYPEALTNTVKVAEMCNVTMEFGAVHLPVFEVPEGYTPETYFEHIARQGLHRKISNFPVEKQKLYMERLNYEIEIIKLKGYASYYLIVWDFINYAKSNNIPVGPGRGSGAGSLAAFAMGITDIDPIRFNLLFERFLNPERKSMPDFDIDFCKNKREQVINYVIDKYGKDKVAQIVTFGQLLARGVIRDVGRVLEIPLKTVDKIAKLIPEAPGMTLKKALKADPSLEQEIENVESGKELLTHARKLEGLLRQTGMHAAGVVISDKPIIQYVPLCKGQNNEVVTQFEKNTLEEIGLVKFDFLGLKNLTVIDYAVNKIREKETNFDISSIPLDDNLTYELLSNGYTTGVFQLESPGMKNLLKKLKPTTFEDIVAVVALYRPGPMGSGMLDDFVKRKHGEQEVTYFIPELEEILKDTYGIIVYQEQVMQIAQIIAGYSLGNADLLRRAMGKKKPEEMQKHKEIFLYGDEKLNIPGAKKKGFDLKKSEEIFDLMAKFAEYGFNKSHSAAYAMVTYQTAFLKAHYPMEYMAALLSNEVEKGDKVVVFIEECKRMGIKVLAPDINESFKDFTIDNDSIRFGLGAIKNVGSGAIDIIVEEREKNGKYKNITDLCKRIDLRQVNRKVIESLIKAGALDCFGKKRSQLLNVLDTVLSEGQKHQKMASQGIMTVFDLLNEIQDEGGSDDDTTEYPDIDEIPENELLKGEKEVLGFYLSSHPLIKYQYMLNILTTSTSQLEEMENDTPVMVGGIVKDIKIYNTKSQEKMAFVTIEDIEGVADVVVFPKLYLSNMRYIDEDKILVIKGRYNTSNDRKSVVAEDIYEITEAIEKLTEHITIKINPLGMTKEKISQIKVVVTSNKGSIPLKFVIKREGKYEVAMSVAEEYYVKPKVSLFKQIEDLIGEDRIEFSIKKAE